MHHGNILQVLKCLSPPPASIFLHLQFHLYKKGALVSSAETFSRKSFKREKKEKKERAILKADFLKLYLGKLNFRCHPLELKVNTFDLIMLIKMYLHSSVLIYQYFWMDLNYIDRKHPFPHIFKYQAGFRT